LNKILGTADSTTLVIKRMESSTSPATALSHGRIGGQSGRGVRYIR